MLLDKIIQGKQITPRITTIYGSGGIGKSTWASRFPDPLFISYEMGTSDLETARTPLITNPMSSLQILNELAHAGTESGFATVVIDSADAAECLFHRQAIQEGISPDFGKRNVFVAEKFAELLRTLSSVRSAGLHVVIVAHAGQVKNENPDGTSFHSWGPKLSKVNSPALVEFSDEVIYARRRVFTRAVDGDYGKKRSVGSTDGTVEGVTQGEPAHIAKARLKLPGVFDLWNFDEYARHNPALGSQVSDEESADEYDYAADDLAFDEARERAAK